MLFTNLANTQRQPYLWRSHSLLPPENPGGSQKLTLIWRSPKWAPGEKVIINNVCKNIPVDFVIWNMTSSLFSVEISQIFPKWAYHVKIDLNLRWKKKTARGKMINFLMIRIKILIIISFGHFPHLHSVSWYHTDRGGFLCTYSDELLKLHHIINWLFRMAPQRITSHILI